MLKKVDMREVAQAATEGARSANRRRRLRRRIQTVVYRAQTCRRLAFVAWRID
ncbi:MAG: hypothetical protein VB124_06000 [Burkholderia sp.]